MNLMKSVSKIDGFYSLEFPEMIEVTSRAFDSPNSLRRGLADFLGSSQYLADSDGLTWLENTNAQPLVTAGQSPVFVEEGELPTMLIAEDYDPRKYVLLLPSEIDRL